jgi:hypothetical protein
MDALFTVLILASFFLSLIVLIALFVRQTRNVVHRTSEFFSDTPTQGRSDDDDGQMVHSLLGQRLLGLIVTVIGGYLVYHIWHEAMLGNSYDLIYAFAAPVMTTLGLGVALFPVDTDVQLRKYGSAKPRNWKETPTNMKVMLVLAIYAGVGNCYALYRMG